MYCGKVMIFRALITNILIIINKLLRRCLARRLLKTLPPEEYSKEQCIIDKLFFLKCADVLIVLPKIKFDDNMTGENQSPSRKENLKNYFFTFVLFYIIMQSCFVFSKQQSVLRPFLSAIITYIQGSQNRRFGQSKVDTKRTDVSWVGVKLVRF